MCNKEINCIFLSAKYLLPIYLVAFRFSNQESVKNIPESCAIYEKSSKLVKSAKFWLSVPISFALF